MSIKSFEFPNRAGQELFRVLVERANAELAGVSGSDRYLAMLLAAIIPVAEVLRDPVAQARDPESLLNDMTGFISRRLRDLLEIGAQ